MTALYTFDVFSTLDGYGAHRGDWGGYWGKQGPEFLDHRFSLYDQEQRMVFGANTYRAHTQMLASGIEESELSDRWVTRMRNLPAIVVSSTLQEPLDWPDHDRRQRRRRRRHRPSQGRIRRSVAFARQPVVESRADGRRSCRPRPSDALPGDLRADRGGPDLPRRNRLRPGADREPDARRPHPRTDLPPDRPLSSPPEICRAQHDGSAAFTFMHSCRREDARAIVCSRGARHDQTISIRGPSTAQERPADVARPGAPRRRQRLLDVADARLPTATTGACPHAGHRGDRCRRHAGGHVGVCVPAAPRVEHCVGVALALGAHRRALRNGRRHRQARDRG